MKRFIKSPLGIGMVTTLFGFTLTVLYDMLKGKQILSTLLNLLKMIWGCIINFLNSNIRVWWILLAIGIIVLILWIIAQTRSTTTVEQDFMKYTNDTIKGWKWEWNWYKGYDGKYDIEGLHLVCDVCGTPLRYDYGGSLRCVRCGKEYMKIGLPEKEDIKLLILDSARRGILPNSNNNKQ